MDAGTYRLAVPMWRYMTVRGPQPTLHEIATQQWQPTTAELTTGLPSRSIFEQFWCYSLYNQGVDCLTDADTTSGFWKKVFTQVSNYMGNDIQSDFILWFVADYHNLAAISTAEAPGAFYHANDTIYWEWNAATSVCDSSSTASIWKSWTIDDWKRCYIMNNNLATADSVLSFAECEETWRQNGAYFAAADGTANIVCQTSSLVSGETYFGGIFTCTNSLGCMTEDPNAAADPTTLTHWAQSNAASNTYYEPIDIIDDAQACVSYQDIVDGYYNVTEAYQYENVEVCYADRVWRLATYPVTAWSAVTYLPSAFDNVPGTNGDFVLHPGNVYPYDIFVFPDEIVDEWLLFGVAFDEIFSLSAIEYVDSLDGDFEAFNLDDFETEDEDVCIFNENREDYRNTQVVEYDGADFYYNRVGQRCFSSSDEGFSNTQYGLMFALDTGNIFSSENIDRNYDLDFVFEMPSDVVASFLDEDLFDSLFIDSTARFQNYTEFLLAVDRVQGVCSGQSFYYSQRDSCKLEIATFLAHVAYESNNFTDAYNDTDAWFDAKFDGMFAYDETQGCSSACSHGPLMLSDADFLTYFVYMLDTSSEIPDTLDPATWYDDHFWLSGLFQFTWANNQPSMLSVATGVWFASDEEWEANIEAGFGATIALRHPSLCGAENPNAGFIEQAYLMFLDMFDMELPEDDVTSCSQTEDISGGYPVNYYMLSDQFFDATTCDPSSTESRYIVFDKHAYIECAINKKEIATFNDMNTDNTGASQDIVDATEAAAYGMSLGCTKMYTDFTNTMNSVRGGFNLFGYQTLRSVRDEFADMRGDNYDIDLDEMIDYYDGEEYSSTRKFLMYDADQSLEITWDEYCVAYDTYMQTVYQSLTEFSNGTVFNKTVADWKTMAAGITADYVVDLYDYNDDLIIEELEWTDAQININLFNYIKADDSASIITTAKMTAAGYSDVMIAYYDADGNTEISFEEWCVGLKKLNSYYALVGIGGSFADDDYNSNYQTQFDINMDGYVSEEEILLGFKWSNDWALFTLDADSFLADLSQLTGDASTYSTAMDANADGKISSREWLDYQAYVANWDNMTAEEGVTTVNETVLVANLYRNFEDYSIWNYTAEMFTTINTDTSDEITLAEYMAWATTSNRFWTEISASSMPYSYLLRTIAPSGEIGAISLNEREFLDLNFDGFIDYAEYVQAKREDQWFIAAMSSNEIVQSDSAWDSTSTEAKAIMSYTSTATSGSWDIDDYYRLLTVDHVWNGMTNDTTATTFDMPTDFDETLFKYYD